MRRMGSCLRIRFRQAGKLFCVLVVLLLLIPPATSAKSRKPFTIAVVPQRSPVEMHTDWIPFVTRLTKELGIEITLKVYEKMADFESDVLKGLPDFIYASPAQTAMARKAQEYIPLVRGSRMIAGVIFVAKDSPIHSVKELDDKEVAFVGRKNL